MRQLAGDCDPDTTPKGSEPLIHWRLTDCGDCTHLLNIKTRHGNAKKYPWCFAECQTPSLFLCLKAIVSEGHICEFSAADMRARRYINWAPRQESR